MECELSAVARFREISKEANWLIKEGQQRCVVLDEITEQKLKELRAEGLFEKYCSLIERKARALHQFPPLSRTAKLKSNDALASKN